MNKVPATTNYHVTGECFLLPTPAGAFHAIESNSDDLVRTHLRRQLALKTTPKVDNQLLADIYPEDKHQALELLYRLQNLGYFQALDQSLDYPTGPLEQLLPQRLIQLVDSGKAILADEQGFYISRSGFTHEAAEELSALSANLYRIHERHRKLLHNNLGVKSSAWSLVDAAGLSEVGFWPLFFPQVRFTLILSGIPQLNSQAFTEIIACLAQRYNQ